MVKVWVTRIRIHLKKTYGNLIYLKLTTDGIAQAQEVSSSELVPARQLSAAAAAEEYSCEFGSTKFYALCALGGVLSCGITHTAVTPLDLVKCRLQVTRILV
jgi:hypothetical protein